jgi:hypothetical protein
MRVERALGGFVLRLAAAYLGLLALFLCVGPGYAKLFLPLFRWEVERVPGLRVAALEPASRGGEQMIVMRIEATPVLGAAQRTGIDGTLLEVPEAIGRFDLEIPFKPHNMYLHPILLLSVLAAWPGVVPRDRLKLFLAALPFLVVLEMVDVPLRIIGSCRHALACSASAALSPGRVPVSAWVHFMDSGGRQVLPVFAAFLCVGCLHIGRFLRVPTPGLKDPCICGSGTAYKRCCMRRVRRS